MVFSRFRKTLLNLFSKPASHLSVLFLVAAILIATTLGAIRTEYAAILSRNLIIHTYQVRDQVAALQMARADIRATAYAYIMRNNPARQARLMELIGEANLSVNNVLNLVQDNPRQAERAKRLKGLIEDQTSQLRACVESDVCSVSDFADDELNEVQAREGEIRALAIAMDDEEARLVRVRLSTAPNGVFCQLVWPAAVAGSRLKR